MSCEGVAVGLGRIVVEKVSLTRIRLKEKQVYFRSKFIDVGAFHFGYLTTDRDDS